MRRAIGRTSVRNRGRVARAGILSSLSSSRASCCSQARAPHQLYLQLQRRTRFPRHLQRIHLHLSQQQLRVQLIALPSVRPVHRL
jgi:hypothetical protein